jgi:CRISPR-associated endonuclease/helicase Cas3
LRFDAGAATRRVRESVGHQSAERRDLPTGGCELTLEVSEVMEMVPWIRSWGPQVEVLEPAWLREQMLGEARRLGEIYGSNAREVELADVFDDFFGG